MRLILPVLMSLALLAGFAGCSKPQDSRSEANPETGADRGEAQRATNPTVMTLVDNQSAGFCRQAKALQQSVNAFLDNPTTDALKSSREQWRQTHDQYAKLQVSYQLAGLALPQIHDDRDPIDAHPMLPGYLDQVTGYPQSGLVYSEVPMTPVFLRSEHQSTDFYYVTLGMHPVEFMLWGSTDETDKQRVALFIPPARPADDQVNAQARRGDLLRLIAHALPRDARDLCAPGQVEALSKALSERADNPKVLKKALVTTLDHLIAKPLAAWKTNPDGEDRNGMLIWHSPLAHTDFVEMKAQLNSLTQQSLPMLVPSPEPPWAKALTTALGQLADRLTSLGDSKSQRTPEVIARLQEQLKMLEDPLSGENRNQAATPSASGTAQ